MLRYDGVIDGHLADLLMSGGICKTGGLFLEVAHISIKGR
jgi:hypothetical protein